MIKRMLWVALLIGVWTGETLLAQTSDRSSSGPDVTMEHLSPNHNMDTKQDSGPFVDTWVPMHNEPGVPIGTFVLVEAGEFIMGDTKGRPNERPLHTVKLDSFYVQAHEVTNGQFRAFVESTGHVAVAEAQGGMWGYRHGATDWQWFEGANWRHPLGSDSDIRQGDALPVVGIAWEDAKAYADWAGVRLLTEAEWEYMARGSLQAIPEARTVGWDTARVIGSPRDSHFPVRWNGPDANLDTEEMVLPGRHSANYWEGQWPDFNLLEDGYFYVAPVGSFAPNPLGIYDVAGNVWEWTSDWYEADYYSHSPSENPTGPSAASGRKVVRGGSWFCSAGYCGSFRFGYRGASPLGRAWNNVGFRVAKDAP